MRTLIDNTKTLTEDLDALGVKGLTEDAMAKIAFGPGLATEACKGKKESEEEPEGDDETCPDCGESPCSCDDEGDDYEESKHDPIDGPFVTPALFDRIMALPFDSLSEEQIQSVIDGLKVKRVPRNIAGIAEQAETVARKLVDEAVAKRSRRAKAHGMGKKVSFQCPPGMRKDPSDPSGKRCVRAAVAAGGAGKLSKIKRKAAKWAKSGAGKKSAKISARWAERRGPQNSDFAVELEHLLGESTERVESVRGEILGRIDSIVEMITQEFDDAAVTAVFNEAVEPIAASYEAGRLDEDVMGVDAFLVELRPVMALISKSLDRMERSDLGNA